jgi:DNA-nicking Smr family endonuclease
MAVEALLRENSRSECVLDLHGFTVQEAIGVLPRKIQEWRSAHQKKFKIIVGRGNRSLTGSKLGPAVKKWLTDNNIRHESEPGSFSLVLL